jgi:CHAT domain-containing protein
MISHRGGIEGSRKEESTVRRWPRRRQQERLSSDLLSDLVFGQGALSRAQDGGNPEDADTAVQRLRAATTNPRASGAFLTQYRTALAEALLVRSSLLGSESDLDEASKVLALAATGPHLDLEAEAAMLCVTSRLHVALAECLGDASGLDIAVAAARRAATISPIDSTTLSCLGWALERRYVMSGDRAALEEAIETYRLALQRAEGENTSSWARAAVNLAGELGNRYERDSALADLDEAIGLAEDALDVAEVGPDRVRALRTLAMSSAARYELLKRAEDLRTTVRAYRELLQSSARSQREIAVDAAKWTALVGKLGGHYDRDEAIHSANAALELLVRWDPDRAVALNILGVALIERWEDERRPADLDRAIEVLAEAAGPGQVERHVPIARHNLGVAMLERSLLPDNPDLTGAASILIANGEPGVDNAAATLLSAEILGRAAADGADWTLAAEVYQAGLTAAQLLVDRQLGRDQKESWLTRVQQLPVEAAYAAVRNGDPLGAVWALETHRAHLFTEALSREAAELSRLDTLGHHDLRSRLEATARQLSELDKRATTERGRLWTTGDVAVRRKAKAAYDRALLELGRLGVEVPSMLGSGDVGELLRDIGDCPLAFVGASRHGGVAILLLDGRLETLDLASLTSAATAERVGNFRQAYGRSAASWRSELRSVLAWASDAVMAPLLDALNTPTAMSLVPVGYLGLLPLHAASGPSGKSVLATTAIRYEPNMRFLRRAQRRAARSRSLRLALGVDGFDDDQPRELGRLKIMYPELRSLRGAAATFAALSEELSGCGLVHFACHARSDLTTPLDSALDIAGSEIDLRSLLEMDLSGVRLAVLAACETHLATRELPDEAVTLLYGLLEAGAASVVGSLWRVDDAATTLLMNRFYEELARGVTAPIALARAQRWLSSANRTELSRTTEGWLPSLRSRIEASTTRLERDLAIPDGRPTRATADTPFADPYYWGAFVHVGA